MPKTTPARALLLVALAVGLAFRLAVVFGPDQGIYWPDEIYQSLEPAHRLVFGYGLMPWEYLDGARTWALPLVVAALLKASALLGGDSPLVYLRVVRLFFALVSLGTAAGAYRLARSFGAREPGAALAAALWALAAPSLYFAHRAMSENASALPVVWGLALLLDRDASRRLRWLGASLLGAAVLLRLQSGVFCLGALGVLLARRAWRPALEALGVLSLWAFLFGAMDAVSWHQLPDARFGGWFHSALLYVRFNLIEGKGAAWGTAPWSYYFQHLWTSMPALTVVLAVGALLAARRAPGLLLVAAAFLALHLAVPHKELRFLLPVLPVLGALAGVGLSALPPRVELGAVAVAAALALQSAFASRHLTFGDLGAYPERAGASAWDDSGPVNRLLLEASRHPDVCGVRIDVHLAWTGGTSYLHHKAPLYMPGAPPQLHHFNYAIVGAGSGAQVVARDGPLELVHLPWDTCAPDPGYSWRLP